MKRIGFIVGFGLVIFSVFVIGCVSTQSNPDTGGIPEAAPVFADFSLDGYWELPEGDIFLFEKNAFVLFYPNGDIDLNGVLYDITDEEIILQLYANMVVGYFQFPYNILPDGNIEVSFRLDWANGIWRKRNDLNEELRNDVSVNPVLGYWERTEGQEITIYHFLQNGNGFQYRTDLNYLLNGTGGGDVTFGTITFDSELPLDRFQLRRTTGDNQSSFSMNMTMRCVIDENVLLIGSGEDLSRYGSFTR